jgi:hypothetical protein
VERPTHEPPMSRALHDALLNHLLATGADPENAAARAAATYPEAARAHQAETRAEAERDARILEDAEQREIRKMLGAIGFRVWNTSQPRAAKVSPGLPDQWITHEARGFAGWFETKRQVGGERSTAQREFGDACHRAGVPYGYGDRFDLARWLIEHGFTPPAIPRP